MLWYFFCVQHKKHHHRSLISIRHHKSPQSWLTEICYLFLSCSYYAEFLACYVFLRWSTLRAGLHAWITCPNSPTLAKFYEWVSYGGWYSDTKHNGTPFMALSPILMKRSISFRWSQLLFGKFYDVLITNPWIRLITTQTYWISQNHARSE